MDSVKGAIAGAADKLSDAAQGTKEGLGRSQEAVSRRWDARERGWVWVTPQLEQPCCRAPRRSSRTRMQP
jgi:hypothetical protein